MDIRMKWYYRLGFLLLLFIVILVFLKLQQVWIPIITVVINVLIPFIIAAFITYLLHPVVEGLHEKGVPRGFAVLIIYLLFFGGVGYAFYRGIPAFIYQLRDLTEHAPEFSTQYRHWIITLQEQTSTWPVGLQQRIDEGITAIEYTLDKMLTKVLDSMVNVLNGAVLIGVIPFIAFYMLKDFNVISRSVWYLTPKRWRKEGILFLRDVDKSLGSYIRGQLLVCVTIGTISSLLFWIFNMKYPLLLGFIIGVTNVIPYFGPIIGAVPAVILSATISVKMVIITFLIIFALQFIEGNILSPLIVGKSLHMHPLMIMFALIMGGEIGGILGLILAVPTLAILKVGIVHARNHFGRSKQNHTESARQH